MDHDGFLVLVREPSSLLRVTRSHHMRAVVRICQVETCTQSNALVRVTFKEPTKEDLKHAAKAEKAAKKDGTSSAPRRAGEHEKRKARCVVS